VMQSCQLAECCCLLEFVDVVAGCAPQHSGSASTLG
jgi:hypothetical protein